MVGLFDIHDLEDIEQNLRSAFALTPLVQERSTPESSKPCTFEANASSGYSHGVEWPRAGHGNDRPLLVQKGS